MIVQGRLIINPAAEPVRGWLHVAGERIESVNEGAPPGRADAGSPECIVSPGFIDAHLHLPQIDAIGRDGLPLLDWLSEVIYPAEANWADVDRARRQITRATARLLRAGTLGYAGFLTSHPHGVEELIRVAHGMPLRAIVGQVLMDRHAPAALLNQRSARLARSARGRVDTSLNPRFAIACSDELLARTGERLREGFPLSLKKRKEDEMGVNLFLQTHLAESQIECAKVRKLFPDQPHYTAVYDHHGLLTRHTLLAHCVHLSDEEWELIASRGSVVVHCPTANTFLQSGLFNLDKAREFGVRLALGSDLAAGPDVAMPRVARAMIEVAKVRRMTIAPDAHIPSPAEVWRLITRGNAEALGWRDAGRIAPGAAADLLVLRPDLEIDANVIGRLIYDWRDDLIESRILRGRLMET